MNRTGVRILFVTLYGMSLLILWPTISLLGDFAKGVVLFCCGYCGLVALGQVTFLSAALRRWFSVAAGERSQAEFISPEEPLEIEREAI